MIEEVGTFLAANSTFFVLGSKTYLNFLPDEPNRASALYETGGSSPNFVFGSSKAMNENARLQVVCRSTSSTRARTDIDKAWTLLSGVKNQTLSPSTYLRIS